MVKFKHKEIEMEKEYRYKHFVITRFNIRANYGCKLKNPDIIQ